MVTELSAEAVGEIDRTKPPFLRRVRIRGYKSIAFCDVALQPLTILVGRNAAGKSNFLDALAFLRDVVNGGMSEALKRPGGWSGILCRTADTPKVEIEIEAGFTCGRPYQRITRNGPADSPSPLPPSGPLPDFTGLCFTATYRLECSGTGTHSIPTISRESLEMVGSMEGGFEVQNGIINKWHSTPAGCAPLAALTVPPQFPRTRSDLPLLAMLGNQPFVDVGEGLRSMGFYNFYPDAIRTLQKPNPGWLLEKDGHNIASVIRRLDEIEPEALLRARDYLSLIAEEVENFSVAPYGEFETVRFGLRTPKGRPPLQCDAASMSDGTLRALAALVAAFQIVLPYGHLAVAGIEEPETALHPAAIRALVDALDEATQHTQILLTAHSADLLSGRDVTPGQVLIVRNRGGETHITPVDPASKEIIEKELYSLGDLQRMDRLDLDEADLKRQTRLSNGTEGM